MMATLQHETFYRTGTWSDKTLSVYAGWTALPGSFAEPMPLHNERDDVVLLFSGEEYSGPQVREELRSRGHALGPAESGYLVHLYEDNPQFVEKLNGLFHGLVVDRAQGKVTLFNDRFGMHRLYYHQSEDTFYFATEAKAILAVRPDLRASDPRSIGEFVACSCVLEDRTIFRDIHVLPAASEWTFSKGHLTSKHTYFKPTQWEEQEPLSAEAYYQDLRSHLSAALPRYFLGEQRTGIAMTGGLDTRVILATRRPEPGSLPSYTFGSKYRDSYDVRVGRRVARVCQQPHQVIEVGDEFLARFGYYADRSIYLSEGTIDVYRASDLYVSEKARQIAPVKIVGTYGSEIVQHAVMFKPVEPQAGLFRPEFLAEVHAAADTYAALRRQNPVTFAAFRQSPWYHRGILALEESQLTVRSPFMDNDFVQAIYRCPPEMKDDVRLRLIRDGHSSLAAIRSDRGAGGNGRSISSAVTRFFREFTFKAEYAYDYGMPQPVARIDHLLHGLHLERLFLGRHKLLHFRVWYRDQLSTYVREMLLDPRTLSRPYLERGRMETLVEDHLSGRRNNTTTIHKLLTLELIHRRFLDAQ
ncbi:MAG TPA: hypothetical protein VHX37_09635 [Acidobacteriaceae bacterium]|nr:hypothetical protein [Acidobacteriaceae bacterium]